MNLAEALLKRMREQQAAAKPSVETPLFGAATKQSPEAGISPPVPQHPQEEMLEAVRRYKAQQGAGTSRLLSREEYEKIKGGG